MKELYRTLIKVIVIFVVFGAITNDLAAYLYTYYQGQKEASQVAEAFAAEYNSSKTILNAVGIAQKKCEDLGVRFIGYEIKQQEITISIQLDVRKTIIIKRVDVLKKYSKIKVSANSNIINR